MIASVALTEPLGFTKASCLQALSVLCTTEDPTGSAAEGVLSEKVVPPPPLRGEWPSVLLYADKPDGAKAHSSGEINLPSSQPMLARIGVATDAPFASAMS